MTSSAPTAPPSVPWTRTALFYLRSRGLSAATAKSLLTYGFAADVLTRIPNAPIRDDLDRLIRGRLGVEMLAAA